MNKLRTSRRRFLPLRNDMLQCAHGQVHRWESLARVAFRGRWINRLHTYRKRYTVFTMTRTTRRARPLPGATSCPAHTRHPSLSGHAGTAPIPSKQLSSSRNLTNTQVQDTVRREFVQRSKGIGGIFTSITSCATPGTSTASVPKNSAASWIWWGIIMESSPAPMTHTGGSGDRPRTGSAPDRSAALIGITVVARLKCWWYLQGSTRGKD